MKWTIAALAAFFISNAFAEGAIQERYMETDVGMVVVTDQPCRVHFEAPGNPFIYDAYATEAGHPNHLGCWVPVDEMTLQIYWPELEEISVFNKRLFLEKEAEPTRKLDNF